MQGSLGRGFGIGAQHPVSRRELALDRRRARARAIQTEDGEGDAADNFHGPSLSHDPERELSVA